MNSWDSWHTVLCEESPDCRGLLDSILHSHTMSFKRHPNKLFLHSHTNVLIRRECMHIRSLKIELANGVRLLQHRLPSVQIDNCLLTVAPHPRPTISGYEDVASHGSGTSPEVGLDMSPNLDRRSETNKRQNEWFLRRHQSYNEKRKVLICNGIQNMNLFLP